MRCLTYRWSSTLDHADLSAATVIRALGGAPGARLHIRGGSGVIVELVYWTSWRTRDEAENAIFAYIDAWYNTRRIQRELGYRNPDEYEAAWQPTHLHQPDSANTTPTPTGVR